MPANLSIRVSPTACGGQGGEISTTVRVDLSHFLELFDELLVDDEFYRPRSAIRGIPSQTGGFVR